MAETLMLIAVLAETLMLIAVLAFVAVAAFPDELAQIIRAFRGKR